MKYQELHHSTIQKSANVSTVYNFRGLNFPGQPCQGGWLVGRRKVFTSNSSSLNPYEKDVSTICLVPQQRKIWMNELKWMCLLHISFFKLVIEVKFKFDSNVNLVSWPSDISCLVPHQHHFYSPVPRMPIAVHFFHSKASLIFHHKAPPHASSVHICLKICGFPHFTHPCFLLLPARPPKILQWGHYQPKLLRGNPSKWPATCTSTFSNGSAIYIMTPDHRPRSNHPSPPPENQHICPQKKYGCLLPNDWKHIASTKCYKYLPAGLTLRVDQKFLHFRASANLQADGASNLYFLEICNFGFRRVVYKVNQFCFRQGWFLPLSKKSQVLLRNNMTFHKMNRFWI